LIEKPERGEGGKVADQARSEPTRIGSASPSCSALVLEIGIVVDDAIVVVGCAAAPGPGRASRRCSHQIRMADVGGPVIAIAAGARRRVRAGRLLGGLTGQLYSSLP